MRVRETIVVEGRDDESAVLSAADANVITTHGYGIRPETLELIRTAYETRGIVILTDPDHAGRKIRERLTALFPDARQAYLSEAQAEKAGDIGVENASPEDIIRALEAAGCGGSASPGPGAEAVTMEDLYRLGLAGGEESSRKRAAAGGRLGIGSPNAGTFLKRVNYLGIGLERLEEAVKGGF
ncbi:MAG: ribonuclease M5 [Firmicutes bacterium]|nr:ribonuclease M5 [Bacillota bacterium]